MLLLEKVSIVTGAAAGIGSSIAKLFAVQGSIVYLIDIDGDACETVGGLVQGGQSWAGTEIKVKTIATTEAWKGAFTRADPQSVSFLLAPGKQKEIDFSEVQEVVRVRKSAKYAPLIGGLAGALAMTLFTSRKGNDSSGSALAGTCAGAALKNTVVFRRP